MQDWGEARRLGWHGAGEEWIEFDPWLAVKSARVRSRKPCGVRTRDKSTKRTPPWAEAEKYGIRVVYRERAPAFAFAAREFGRAPAPLSESGSLRFCTRPPL